MLTTTPGQTASALSANQALGLNVPVLGNNPTFDPALLASPAASALGNLYVSASNAPFSSPTPKAVDVVTKFKQKYPEAPKNAGVITGYTEGQVWQAVLTKACESGDLSRAGVATALTTLTSVKTEDLVTELDYSSPGSPPTRGVYIAKVDANAEGGLTEVAPLFTAPEAEPATRPRSRRADPARPRPGTRARPPGRLRGAVRGRPRCPAVVRRRHARCHGTRRPTRRPPLARQGTPAPAPHRDPSAARRRAGRAPTRSAARAARRVPARAASGCTAAAPTGCSAGSAAGWPRAWAWTPRCCASA